MALRKEPVVFLAVLAFCGWRASAMLKDTPEAPRARRGAADYSSSGGPDIALALPDATRDASFERNLFAPPSATSPLPRLLPELPRFEPLGALAPPTGFGPAPKSYGELLRVPARPDSSAPMPDLFAVEEEDPEPVEALETVSGDDEGAPLPDDPDARAARIAGLKKQYDWIFSNGYKFGRIRNDDRYRIVRPGGAAVEGTEIEFVEYDITKGRPRFGDTSITYVADEVRDFGLVDNALTEVEVGIAWFQDPLLPQNFAKAIEFAQRCLLLRNETPRALEVAEELFRRAQAINTGDSVEPRLGLARCYELGFRLQDAYDVYEELLADGFGANPTVHARLGSLLATLRLDAEAEARFTQALRVARGDWETHWRYGNFLAERGRVEEARQHLEAAVAREPRGDEARVWRVRVRFDAACAALAAGDADAALSGFSSAKAADPADEVGMLQSCEAGVLSAARFASSGSPGAENGAGGQNGDSGGGPADGSFDLLLARGLAALDAGRFEEAARVLEVAAGADPFRSFEAKRALSRVAEVTGNPEIAETFAREALAANPDDAWTLYQLGRLAEADLDDIGARAAYRAALALELDLTPALERMGKILNESGEFEDAERYFQRAVAVAGDETPSGVLAGIHSRRGWNALALGDLDIAGESFDKARDLKPSLASARLGVAWLAYASGDSTEALALFGDIVDDRRASTDEVDPYVAYAEAQMVRITEHEKKEVFRDRFDRTDGRIANGWREDQGVGPLSDLREGAVRIEGQHDASGRTRVYRTLPPDRLLAFSAVLTVGPEAKGTRTGLFVSQERDSNSGEPEVRSELLITRTKDGKLQVLTKESPTDDDAVYKDVLGPEWPIGAPIRVAIERTGDDLQSRWTVYVDGEPVAQDLDVGGLTSARNGLRFGAFVEGDTGRRADLTIDDVRVVRLK